uniref:Bm8411 n=1 Tax=Brugia malayi TaxID=6279 RepID=A0A0H5S256_BRUMA|nr:Bm8411 [Brugia malayi]
MLIQNGDCTMQQRQRVTSSLEGIMFFLTIVVTRADRVYRCMCFSRNIKRLTSDVDMSSIGITELMDALDLDRCAIDPIIQPDVKYDGDLKKVNIILEKGAHDISDLHNGHQIDLVATISMLNNIEENGASDPRPRYLVREVSKMPMLNIMITD